MADTAASLAARRNRLLGILGAIVVVGVVAWGLYYLLVSSHHVETDNAYVGADTALVTPLIAGPVAKVLVVETQLVKAGDPLIVLDDSDAKIAVAEAQAALGQAERRVQGYYASDTALAGQVAAKQADISRADAAITSAQSDLDRAKVDLDRRKALASSGAVSGDELTTAENRYATAQSALVEAKAAKTQAEANRAAAVGSRDVNNALITGVSEAKNPEIAAAEARLAAAQLMLDRTVLRAPIGGIVSKKAVEIGQQVQVGAPLMSVVPIDAAFVDANFKEVQLEKIHPGQRVTLTADLYGKSIKFHGKVRGLAGGTGSAFSLIPAQNATGNWIKVVQRLPVRIDLDPADLRAHPLRIGLSMKAEIDTDQG